MRRHITAEGMRFTSATSAEAYSGEGIVYGECRWMSLGSEPRNVAGPTLLREKLALGTAKKIAMEGRKYGLGLMVIGLSDGRGRKASNALPHYPT